MNSEPHRESIDGIRCWLMCALVVLLCVCCVVVAASSAWKVRCPLCPFTMHPPVVKIQGTKPSTKLSALEVAKLMPISHALVQATRAASAAAAAPPPPAPRVQPYVAPYVAPPSPVVIQQSAPKCMWPGCKDAVTHFCVTKCGDQCRKHEAEGHAAAGGFGGHIRLTVQQRAAQQLKDKQEAIESMAQGVRKSLTPLKTTLAKAQTTQQRAEAHRLKMQHHSQQPHSRASLNWLRSIDGTHVGLFLFACRCRCRLSLPGAKAKAEVAAEEAAIQQLEASLPMLRRNLAQRVAAAKQREVDLETAYGTGKSNIDTAKAECDRLSALSAEQTLTQKDKFTQLDSKVQELADASTRLQAAIEVGPVTSLQHPLIQAVIQMHTPAILSSLAASPRAHLTGYLGDIPLVS